MSGSPVRRSLVKNVFGEPWKEKYVDVKLSGRTVDGNLIACSPDFLAGCWEAGGGGSVGVVALSEINKRNPSVTLFKGHKAAVQDVQFSPFYSSIFVTSSEDASLKLWDIPMSGELELRRDCVAVLSGHDKKVSMSLFNPVAEWILASCSLDCTIKIWDMENVKCAYSISQPTAANLVRWNYTGTLISSTGKDKTLRIVDPRSGKDVAIAQAHEGSKPSRCEWLDGERAGADYILTTGFDISAGRELALWDTRNMGSAVSRQDIDRQSGVIQPTYDYGSNLVFLCGKGDGNVRFYELAGGGLVKLGAFSSNIPAREMAFMPKRAMEVMKCECMRGYKAEGGSVIQPISFVIPRRNAEFQADIFPPCPSGDPSLTSEEWLQGKSSVPVCTSMEPVNGQSPFHARVPHNVRNLKFTGGGTAVSNTNAVLSKKLTMKESQMELDRGQIEEMNSRIKSLMDLINARNSQIEELERELEREKQSAKTVEEKCAMLEMQYNRAVVELSKRPLPSSDPGSKVIAGNDKQVPATEIRVEKNVENINISDPPLAEPIPGLDAMRGAIASTNEELRRVQTQATKTRNELQKLRTEAAGDYGHQQESIKAELDALRSLLADVQKSTNTLSPPASSRQKASRHVSRTTSAASEISSTCFGHDESEVLLARIGMLEKENRRIARDHNTLKGRNETLEQLFSSLSAAGKSVAGKKAIPAPVMPRRGSFGDDAVEVVVHGGLSPGTAQCGFFPCSK